MGHTKYYRGAKNYDGSNVRCVELDFGSLNERWVQELKQKAGKTRSIPFYSQELFEASKAFTDEHLFKMQGIQTRPGESTPDHPHAVQDVLIYMPMDHPTPLLFNDPDIEFETARGRALWLPKGQWHSVPKNETDFTRFVIALVFQLVHFPT